MKIRSLFLLIVLLGVLTGLFSCNDKICPSYSSFFILDNSNAGRIQLAYGRADYPDISNYLYENQIRDKYFAYLDEDSIPRTDFTDVSKNRFGIIDKKGYRKKAYSMQTIPMEVVIPEADDSLKFAGDEQLVAELDIVDSAAIDSVSVLGKTYKYNNDQKYYLWYLRNKLVWKDELGKDEEEGEELPEGEEGEAVEEKQGFFKRISSKFKNLFKKKDKESDPAVDDAPVDEATEEVEDGF